MKLSVYQAIAQRFREERKQRLGGTKIIAEDFEALTKAGFLRLSAPQQMGGEWRGVTESGPIIAEVIRCIAKGDPGVALVAAMHPSVVAYWHPTKTKDGQPTLTDQAKHTFATVLDGHWWGTMMSEPGSGGDLQKTKTQAAPEKERYKLTGEKHFASGSGQTSFMVTTARVDDQVDLFVVDTRDRRWDGTTGLTLLREWDGHGMTGTQSHAFTLTACDAQRAERANPFPIAIRQTTRLSGVLFCAVVIGILDEAFGTMLERLESKRSSLRALEQVELVRAKNEHWQAVTLYVAARDAMGHAGGDLNRITGELQNLRQTKYAIARHAENALARLSKVVGGSSYGRDSALGQWSLDVKALGFLRPPWALHNDQLFEALWKD